MEDAWDEAPNKKRSETSSKNRTSNLEGFGIPCHVSEAKKHNRVAYVMSLENDGVPPPAIEIVRRTHTRKDGIFIDKQAESHVEAAETLAKQRQEASNVVSLNGSNVTEPSYQQLSEAYIEVILFSSAFTTLYTTMGYPALRADVI